MAPVTSFFLWLSVFKVFSFRLRNFTSDTFVFQEEKEKEAVPDFGSFFDEKQSSRNFGFTNTLRPPNWELETLEPFVKDFYKAKELPHIKNMDQREVEKIRQECRMIVIGEDVPNPVSTFQETTLDGIKFCFVKQQRRTDF